MLATSAVLASSSFAYADTKYDGNKEKQEAVFSFEVEQSKE